jgi:hypothetical protein
MKITIVWMSWMSWNFSIHQATSDSIMLHHLTEAQILAPSLGRMISLASQFHTQNFGTLPWPRGAESTLFYNFSTINKSWLHQLAGAQFLAPSLDRMIGLASRFYMQNFGTLTWPRGAESTLFYNFWTITKSWLHHLVEWWCQERSKRWCLLS